MNEQLESTPVQRDVTVLAIPVVDVGEGGGGSGGGGRSRF